ncbi:DDE_3 domain-containing protein [Trichonephila clavipes]|nr:DDE_3 domain-containing protein [Trichonephila clavipes]
MPWILHERLELYKGMVAQSWFRMFFRGAVWNLWCVYQPPSMELSTWSCWVITSIRLCCSVISTVKEFSSKTTVPLTGLLPEHSSDFSVIYWSPRSPDLSPIEHLWDVLEQGVKGHHTAPKNLSEVWTALANIWQVILVERFQKRVESMPHFVVAVINARGGPTHY